MRDPRSGPELRSEFPPGRPPGALEDPWSE